MLNIFAALRDSKAEVLAIQLALLENVTTFNALSPYGQKAYRSGTATVNWVASAFRRGPIVSEPVVTELKDLVQGGFRIHKNSSSDYLLTKLRGECCKRLGLSETDSDTAISVKLVHEAAAFYDIDDWLTPAEQAESVSRRYQEESLAKLRKEVSKMSPQQRVDLEKQVSADLQNLPYEERDKILQDMKLDTLSGEALISALITAGGPFASIGALTAAGFGAFLALTTIIHAVVTTAFGITLPFAVYTSATSALGILTGPFGWTIAALVMIGGWRMSERKLSRGIFAGLLTVASESAEFPKPSRIIAASIHLNPTDVNEAALTANALEQQRLRAESNADSVVKKIAVENKNLERSQAAHQRAEINADSARRKLASSTDLSEKQISRLKESLAKAEDTVLLEMSKSEEHQRTISQLKLEIERLQKSLDEARVRQGTFEEGEGKRLLELWAIHLPKMVFERQPVSWTVHRNHNERLSLERKLMELHGCEDPAALSRGKMRDTGEHHLKFRLDAVECRMYYRVNKGEISITKLGSNQQTHK